MYFNMHINKIIKEIKMTCISSLFSSLNRECDAFFEKQILIIYWFIIARFIPATRDTFSQTIFCLHFLGFTFSK